MFIPDLSPYRQGNDSLLGIEPLAVGWLRGDKPYPTGPVSPEFVERLLDFCMQANSLPAGRREARCALSRECRSVRPMQTGDRTLYFDSEIRVIGEADIFAAPALIYHYVTAHQYRPPAEFVNAVSQGAAPSSAEHQALIKSLATLRR